MIMSQLTPLVSAHYGAFFMMDVEEGKPILALMSSYAYSERKGVAHRFHLRQGLVGQCAYEKKAILITNVPSDYIQISSGLGEAHPLTIIVLPVLFEGEVKGVIELASFHPFSPIHQLFLSQLTESIGVVLNVIIANMRTEELLQQSQGLTQELQIQSKELTVQQDELKRSNLALEKQALELEEKARQLANQNRKVEEKNREVEQARVAVEDKATQLALISKYKSEFLANMSHELRTPLNSLLILAKMLSENGEKTLSDKQVEYAKTIYGSGVDLLSLINEILDLSKVESGKMRVEPRTIPLEELSDFVKRTFEPVAAEKRLSLTIGTSPDLKDISTDPQRLQQVLKNLLSNAFKFTDTGGVSLRMLPAPSSMKFEMPTLLLSDKVIAFEVRDTGIGIPKDKQKIVFEAFQQLDGNTNRKYGGTGLGLSISREIARLLGGEIRIESTPGEGSAFTLYLPERVGMDLETLTEEHATPMVLATPRAPIALPSPPRDSEPNRANQDLTRPTILVVDDDFRNIFAMSSILEGRGLNVIYAENGRGALEALAKNDVSLVLLDIMMPEMDGYETITAIRSTGRHTNLPVIAVTAKALNEDREKCLAIGATDFLPKPVDPDRLLKIIDAYCGVSACVKDPN
jgi:signal transduction histidine kinase/ActR/RegA family two-component response regulator